MNNKVIGWVIVVVVVAGGIWYWQTKKEDNISNNQTPIKIGVVLSLSGYGAEDGEAIKRGLDLAQEKLKEKGVDVELLYQDDATDAKQTVSATRQLITSGVDALIGWQWSYLMQPSLPIINESKIVAFAPSLSYGLVAMPSEYVFYGYISTDKKTVPLTEWFKEQKIKKPAFIVNGNFPWSESHLAVFQKAILGAGGKEVLAEKVSFGSESSDISIIMIKAKNLGADAILWSGSYDGEIIIAKRLGELNWNIPFLSDENITVAIGKKQIPENNMKIFTFSKENVLAEEFKTIFKNRYNSEPLHYSDSAYDSLMILVNAIKNHGDTPLNDYIRQNTDYNGYNTKYQFNKDGDILGGAWKVIRAR